MDIWQGAQERVDQGTWRDQIFHDLILEDVRRLGRDVTILDIGCGRGLDGNLAFQKSIAAAAHRFIGIEPDPAIELDDTFDETHRCVFEDAPLEPGSVDVSYAAMVLEHIREPQRFWSKLHEALSDGGVFWALTVDGRHPYCWSSYWLDRLHLKNLYLTLLFGQRGIDRYENYPTYYRTNVPKVIAQQARAFRDVQCQTLFYPGLWKTNYPRPLRPLIDVLERRRARRKAPGMSLLVRVVK